jgi:hypothetical protein
VYRELKGRIPEIVNAATTTSPAEPKVKTLALRLLVDLVHSSRVRAAELWAILGTAGRAAVVTAATNPTEPEVAMLALVLLTEIAGNSDVKKAELWAALGPAGRTVVVAAATNPRDLNVAEQALFLLTSLAHNSNVRAAELWATLGLAGRAAVVAAATNPTEPEVAEQALGLLARLTSNSEGRKAKLWATLGPAGRTAFVTAATTPAEPEVAKQALYFLASLASLSEVRATDLWATFLPAQCAAVVTAATTPTQPEITKNALNLLAGLAGKSAFRDAELWSALGHVGRAAVVTAALPPAEPEVAAQALRLLVNLTDKSETIKANLWAILGPTGRAALITAATPSTEPEVAQQALHLLANLVNLSEVRAANLWATLETTGRAALATAAMTTAEPGVATCALTLLIRLTNSSHRKQTEVGTALWKVWTTSGETARKGLIITATTVEKPKIASVAIYLLRILNKNSRINTEIWPLLQPRLAQLWAVTPLQNNERMASNFLFKQIRGDANKIRQALNALNAAIPAISMRHTIATLREWGEQNRHDTPERAALLTGIVQTHTTPQKMAVLTTAVMSGINIRQRPQGEREALRDQLLAIPLAEEIDPTLYRKRMRLGFDVACGNTSAVIDSQDLSDPEKLQLLEVIYCSPGFLTAQATQENFSKMLLAPNISRDFKLQAIGLILNHGRANPFQLKTALTWLKGEFKKDTYTVFTSLGDTGDIGDAAIYALAVQRQQYLSLYRNFQPHMTYSFIQTEIENIHFRVAIKEVPENFGTTLIFQLQQFLSTAGLDTAAKDDRKFEKKSESK